MNTNCTYSKYNTETINEETALVCDFGTRMLCKTIRYLNEGVQNNLNSNKRRRLHKRWASAVFTALQFLLVYLPSVITIFISKLETERRYKIGYGINYGRFLFIIIEELQQENE